MPHRLEKMLDQYYNLIENALNEACPKQKEIIINRNNPWHKGTLKQLRLEKFARHEEYKKDRNNAVNKKNYYNTLNKYRRLCKQKQKKHERDQMEAMGNEAEMSKYLNKILKSKAKKDIGTLKKNNGDYTIPGIDTLEEMANKPTPRIQEKKQQCTQKYQLEKRTKYQAQELMVMLNSNLRGMHVPKPKLSKWAYTGVVRPKLLMHA